VVAVSRQVMGRGLEFPKTRSLYRLPSNPGAYRIDRIDRIGLVLCEYLSELIA